VKKTSLSLLFALAVAACAVSSVEPLSIPLIYTPSPKPEAVLAAVRCPAVARIQVADERADKRLGERVHESKPLRADVAAANDPAEWAREGVEEFMAHAGVALSPGGPVLMLKLEALRTAENIWHRSGYDARILFDAQLLAPSGRACWQESVEGHGGNYGYSGSIVDYQETLNSALDAATLRMLDSASFNAALCHCAD
jgi:hypothetical protein